MDFWFYLFAFLRQGLPIELRMIVPLSPEHWDQRLEPTQPFKNFCFRVGEMDQWVFVPAAHPDILTLVVGTNKVGGKTRFSPVVFQPFVPSKHTQIKMFYKIKFCFKYQMDFCLLRIIKFAGSSSSKPSTVKQDTICSKRYFINSIRHKLITFHNRCCLYEMVLYKNS